ncbi:hypothetical protein P2G88_01380 [Aliiglaciecola sp. CAU 1673]|uniref:hypothetical protein n=1 Tax=Aliiglaciecola sp. CAU 1673 TaxID=3032595 RepID=UPI0023D9F5FE|nr:hypothetical protein [Aliiglaciecola sp. CAU 1673]MDF2176903.1 hypothetical protein [Aliiglaciecola sp. CAU 1673]
MELPGNLFTLLDMPERGNQLELLGEEIREGKPAYLLKVILKDDHHKFYLLDKADGTILASRDLRAFHPDLDNREVLVETRYSDFRPVKGMIRPFLSDNYDLTNKRWLGTSQILDIRTNMDFGEAMFAPETLVATEWPVERDVLPAKTTQK